MNILLSLVFNQDHEIKYVKLSFSPIFCFIFTLKESDTTEGAAKEEKMDVDDAATKTGSKAATGDDGGEEDYSEVMNDPEFLQVSILSPILTYKVIGF